MSNKKKLLIALATLVVIALTITGILFAQNQKNDDIIAPGPVPTTTDTATAPATITADQKKIDEIAEKVNSFDKATEVANFTKEDVQSALKTSVEFANISLSTGYYLSGQWVKDGMPNNLDDAVGRYFSADVRETIKKIETDPAKNNQVSKDVMPLVFFLYPADRVAGHPSCLEENIMDKSAEGIHCPIEPLEISNMSYDSTTIDDVSGILVKFSATAKVPVLFDGKDAYTEVTNDFTLNFIANEKYDEKTNPNKFVINKYSVATNVGAVSLVKE